MKTKISIFGCFIVAITLAIMVSCQKSETPAIQSSTPNVSSTSPVQQPNNRRAHSPIDVACSTYEETPEPECTGAATDCLCDVVVSPGWWQGIIHVTQVGTSTATAAFFSDTTNVRNTFPILLSTAGKSCDSELCSGNYYLTVEQTPSSGGGSTEFFFIVKENTSSTLAFVMPCDTN